MLRKTARERRQYLHGRMQQLQEAQLHEKRSQLKRALENDKKNISREIRDDAKLRADYRFDDSAELADMDDEYRTLGEREPKILITTSRDPSTKLAQFAKEFRLLIPNSQRINRGNHVVRDIVGACRASEVTDLIVLHETRGKPDALVISHFPYGPTVSFSLHNVVLRHDIPDVGTVSEAYPNLILDNMSSKLGKRTSNVLKALFPPSPPAASPRVVTFANRDDYISFRNHVFVRTGNRQVELAEVGPRFEMRMFEIKLGTIDQEDADVEWRLRPYQRHRRSVMAEEA
ncbi:snoRNA-binding rRNA-processing protein imp4 [Savitreella phatthalungensis]